MKLEQSMKIDIKLDVFEGPLDLLLHLIEKNKVSIYDIPIVEITNQYMEYIREMEKSYSMESMSEFLVMAATLLKIKSKMLLPQPEKEEEEEVRLQHHDLIDSFIKNEEQRTPGSGLNLDMETTGAPVPENLAELEENQHKPLDDSYFTETLAHIYVKQKRYEKALQIIKNLNLKYPEKNVYFADQIRFLEKLIINTKK